MRRRTALVVGSTMALVLAGGSAVGVRHLLRAEAAVGVPSAIATPSAVPDPKADLQPLLLAARGGRPIRVVGMGSSVGVGAELPDPAAQAPVGRLAHLLRERFPGLGVTVDNRSVNGSTTTDGLRLYTDTVRALHPTVLLLTYGMNDGQTAQFNSGESLPGSIAALGQIVSAARQDGTTVLIETTPSPDTDGNDFSLPGGLPVVYPTPGGAPDPQGPAAVVRIHGQPFSARHAAWNDAARRLAKSQGVALLDAAAYWPAAVAAHGQDALFNVRNGPADAGRFVHPDLLGHRSSYWKAERAFTRSLPAVSSVPLRANTTYFIAPRGCSDGGNGSSARTPWCSTGPITERRLLPGDRLLFACGGTWQQPGADAAHPLLALSGTGTAADPIRIGTYDSGTGRPAACLQRPHLIGGGPRAEVVSITDPDHWSISGLELSSGAVGLRVHFTTAGHRDVSVRNLAVHDFTGIFRGDCSVYPYAYTALGILFDHAMARAPEGSESVLRGVRIEDVEGYHNQGSIGIMGYGCAPASGTGSNLYEEVLIKEVHLHDDHGPSGGCSDGLQLIAANRVTVVDSRFEREGGCFTDSGTTGVILGEVQDVAFVDDLFSGTPDTNSPDQSAIDFEAHTRRVSIVGSYFGGNAGAALEFLTISGDGNFHTGFRIAANAFEANSSHPLAGSGEEGHIWRGGPSPEPVGTIAGNLYSAGTPFTGGDLSSVRITRNTPVSAIDSVAAAWGSTRSRWSTEARVGAGAWRAVRGETATVDGVTVRAGRFVLSAGSCRTCEVARTWKAPRDGVVSIRGAAMLDDSDRASARLSIESRGSVALRSTVGAGAVETSVHRLKGEAGDEVRCVAALAGGGAISWAPSLGYID